MISFSCVMLDIRWDEVSTNFAGSRIKITGYMTYFSALILRQGIRDLYEISYAIAKK